jgi:hypothetical protein
LVDIYLKEKGKMTECPKCGSDYGFFKLSKVSGFAKTTFNWDGTSGNSSDMHDNIYYRPLKTLKCCQCGYKLNKKQCIAVKPVGE